MNIDQRDKKINEAVAQANFILRKDVLKLLRKAYQREANQKAKKALSWILENAAIASKEKLAICQDTGLPIIFIEIGRGFLFSVADEHSIKKAVEKAYKKCFLRESIVDPFRLTKPSYQGVISHIECVTAFNGLRITIFPKGFGSENKSQLKMFNPTVTCDAIDDFIVASVKEAGANACPPFIVGVGIGGTSDYALLLAKKALLGRIDVDNKDQNLKAMEKRLMKRINALSIGPMGFSGSNTALAVKIKTAPTHIAGLPVAVNISCHALRSATVHIK